MNQLPRVPISKKSREEAKDKYGGRCGYCGCVPKTMHVDHIKPVACGGTNSIENLMPSCSQCNNFKMTFTLEQFRAELSAQVDRARRYSVNFRNAERFGQVVVTNTPIVFYFESQSR